VATAALQVLEMAAVATVATGAVVKAELEVPVAVEAGIEVGMMEGGRAVATAAAVETAVATAAAMEMAVATRVATEVERV
jgi:hypothetical protein